MTIDKMTATDMVQATTKYNTMPSDQMAINGYYHAVCYGADGQVKWEAPIENLVTTVGKNLTLDTILGNSAAGAVVMGLKGTGTAVAADTQASHASWLEVGGTNACIFWQPSHTVIQCGFCWQQSYVFCGVLFHDIDWYSGWLLH